MIILEVFVVFHALNEEWYSKLVTLSTGSSINHSGIMVRLPDNECVYYLTRVDRNWKLIDADRYFNTFPPHSYFYIGSTTYQDKKVINLDDEYIVRPWKLMVWYYCTRFIWPFWKPKGCTTFVSKVLQSMGFKIKTHGAPVKLLKELKNADHYIERQGESWKDLVG